MRYFLEIQIENEAFIDDPHNEIAMILDRAKDRLRNAAGSQINPHDSPLRDTNGNKCGRHGFDNKRVRA